MRHLRIRRAALPLVLLALMSCGGSDDPGTTAPDPPRATSMTVSQGTLSMSYLGQVSVLTATVLDQFGRPFTATVTWSSDAAAIATVNAQGQVTAVENGVTTVRATSGSLTASAAVTVQQVATRMTVVSGSGQSAMVGEALGEVLVAQSVDQGGSPVPGASVTFTVDTESASVSVAEAVTDEDALATTAWTLGTVSGPQRVTAAIAGLSTGWARFDATALAGPATGLSKTSGDQQVGTVGIALADPVAVTVTDAFGNGVPGTAVSFDVTDGGGSVTPEQAASLGDGTAQATWTMGSGVGANTLTATAPGLPAVEFTASAEPARADLQPGAVTTKPVNPTALQPFEIATTVTNQGYLSTGSGFQVEWRVDGATVGTTALPALDVGEAVEATFGVGPLSPGSHTLGVVVDAGGTVEESDEGNNSADAAQQVPLSTLVTAGTSIPGLSGATETERLFTVILPESATGSLVISTSGGSGDVDMYVNYQDRPADRDDYQCQSGSPSTSETCVFNDAEPGTYHIVLYAFSEFSGTTLRATANGPVVPYDIELKFINRGTATQDAAFEAAAETWMRVLRDDVNGLDFTNNPVDANACTDGQPLIAEPIDDLRIYVDIINIDGPGGTLAQAGPCILDGLSQLPVLGAMKFDASDLDNLEAVGGLLPVVLHEMAHVLGVGTTWRSDRFQRLRNPSRPSSPGVDTYFTGPNAIAAFDAAGGTSTYTLGEKVPVENQATEGSSDAHWRESVLGLELMTPFYNAGEVNPLSAITIQSLADVGYRVDASQAQPYRRTWRAPARVPEDRRAIDLQGDVRVGPIWVVGKDGRKRELVRR